MKVIVLLLGCLACGCTTSSAYYTVMEVAPAKEPGKYLARAVVDEHHSNLLRSWGGQRHSPILTCEAGKKATHSATLKDGTNETFETYVAKRGDKKPSTLVYTREDDGRVLTRTELRLPPLASAD
jgi:hypothetical protein